MVAGMRVGVEVEQQAAGILVEEGRFGFAVDGLHLDGTAGRCRSGYLEVDGALAEALDTGGNVAHADGKRDAGVVHEEVSVQGGDGAGSGMLVLHGRNGRAGNQYAEVHLHGVGAAGNQVHLVGHHAGNLAGDIHQQGVPGNVAVIENGLLVIEQELIYAGEIFTHQANAVAHIGAGEQGICRGSLHGAHIVNRRLAVGKTEAVRVILARSEADGCTESGYRIDAYFIYDLFHCLLC